MTDTRYIEVKPLNGERNREELIALTDREITRFNTWFTETFPGNQPLSKYEAAILRTYLMHAMEQSVLENTVASD